jgi:hypothetical protein
MFVGKDGKVWEEGSVEEWLWVHVSRCRIWRRLPVG